MPPPVPAVSKDYGKDKPAWVIAGARNRADPWGKVPFLLGRFRLTPPYAAIPYREIVGGDVYWRAIFALSHGPGRDRGAADRRDPARPTSPASRPSCAAATGRCPTRAPGIRRARPTRPSPAFGETWTASAAGSVGGVAYKAGETITFNGLAPATSAAGWDRDQGKPFKLYPKDVYEEGFAVEVETSVVRTTQANADEIGVELTFPARPLPHRERPAGQEAPTAPSTSASASRRPAPNTWTTVATKTVTARQLTPLFIGHRWKTADYGTADANRRYDVEITNLSGSFDEERNFGRFQLIALRTITTENPVAGSPASP